MMLRSTGSLALAFLLFFASNGCSSGSGAGSSSGGGSSNGSSSSSGGSSSGAPITLPGGGQVPMLTCGSETVDSAIGTWDVVASNTSEVIGIGLIVIKDNQVRVESSGRTFSYQALGGSTISWKEGPSSVTQAEVAKRTPSDLDLGVLPLRLGGTWSFGEGGRRRLQLTVADGDVVAEATSAVLPSDFGGGLNGTIRGTRTEPRTSAFGRLGGVWKVVGVDGADVMTVVVDGATFTVFVTGEARDFGKRDSWLTLRVCNDGAVGKTSLGVDVAAVRR